MYVDQVAALFRQYIDEPDRTFVTDADVATYLAQGYAEFRRHVMSVDNNVYVARVTLAYTGSTYDLADPANAVTIMGAGPLSGGSRLERILQVWAQNTDQLPLVEFRQVRSYPELEEANAPYWGGGGFRYMLDGTVLRLSTIPNRPVVVRYVPAPAVDWTRQTSGDNEWIDDLEPFHDLIALLAYAQYAIRDGAESVEVLRQADERKGQLGQFLLQGRGGASGTVPDLSNW